MLATEEVENKTLYLLQRAWEWLDYFRDQTEGDDDFEDFYVEVRDYLDDLGNV